MIAERRDNRDCSGKGACLAVVPPEFIPVALFTAGFANVAADDDEIGGAGSNEMKFYTIPEGLITLVFHCGV